MLFSRYITYIRQIKEYTFLVHNKISHGKVLFFGTLLYSWFYPYN